MDGQSDANSYAVGGPKVRRARSWMQPQLMKEMGMIYKFS